MSDITDEQRGLATGAKASKQAGGRTFASARAAARDAISRFNPVSIAQNLEYGGTIYQLPKSNRFSYGDPPNIQAIGTRDGQVSTAQRIPSGAREAGRWHTHGMTKNYTDESFSDQDLKLARARGIPSWLGTPKGSVKVAVPVKGGVMILDIDPAESTRPNIRSKRL